MNFAFWTAGIACIVAISIFAGIKRMRTKASSIGTSPLVNTVAVSQTPDK